MQGFPFALIAVLAFNTGIAGLLSLVGYGGSFGENFVFSQCIGLSVLLLIHIGWRGFWPVGKPPRLPLLGVIALGILGGWLGGSALASVLLGMPWTAGRSAVAALGVTIAAGLTGTWFFWSRHKAADLERARIEAQLKLLQAQIEPHFLFNTLANLDALIATDPARARVMLGHLNDYLRATLVAARKERNSLAEEFALLRNYLEVLAIRMGARLRFELALPAPLAALQVPPMLLQPLVENAVKHGLEPKVEGGSVKVSAREEPGRLVLEVADTGQGVHDGEGGGVGLANLRERLAAAFGGVARVDAGANAAGGYTVTLSLPR
ncbi:MAG: histidine kinase [Betaproteobacteria bacterium]|nr:histidine kinase [Betaproteobacteria bacterium]MDH4325316.1 histidine kinase [Betaproteobacteria bacterium]MDH5578007.1 histidine kinase [Betaproteobacteria bacterium]